MGKVSFVRSVFIMLACSLTSCFSNQYEEIGKKKVEGSTNLYVKIYQKDQFEHLTPVAFELINKKDSILIHRRYFTGETPMLQNVEDFYPFLYDSIFYICYPYPVVYAIQHLDTSKSDFSRDTLFKKLKKYDDKLIGAEEQ
ncbi:hypothetical protein FNH22_09080 [Fulvivirga sp. M361]|uniref:hypothetical protein n=1 Tax=Fulvivirga sp. M361 TaxID=2594266 RepID=UPI00117A6585|nr:hypothetical protein [Fulvivirga sp. M361]TRX60190.1 hypothetical protein FNH22_09080 [Fulvivirga sp. M361]